MDFSNRFGGGDSANLKMDAHVHSTCSDGSCTVWELCEMASASGITHLSFTDHDTTKTHAPALEAARQNKIALVPGIEISAYDYKRNRKVHILGYRYNSAAARIDALCGKTLENRNAHSRWQLARIRESGIRVEEDAIERLTRDSGVLYKQFIMAAITASPFLSEEYQTLYRRLFKEGGVAAGDIAYCDARAAVRAVKADGGLAVLAHPGMFDSYDLIPELLSDGLDGLELCHPAHTERDLERIRDLAERHRLFVTGGSDYHGAFGKPEKLGFRLSPLDWLRRL
ncbi:MAG: PHP domain-containing protein [Clostridiales Family XIII bacterium]|jgi:predicted metal-dependent phosphoesterase TrpH|nr:PHP domain-containing protein [Clostridiales Family XIII bacterium]